MLAAHGVIVAYLFGSQADGTAGPTSDTDLAVIFKASEPAFAATESVAQDVAGLVSTTVDVVDLVRATIELRGKVAMTGKLLYSTDEPRRVAFQTDALNRWFDFRPFLEATTTGYLRRVAAEGLR